MKQLSLWSVVAIGLSSCAFFRPVEQEVELAEVPVEVSAIAERPVYQASETRVNDIIHTQLNVRFDWTKQYLHGDAAITIQPYFHPVDELVLDAKGFDIHGVWMQTKNGNEELQYEYDGWFLTVALDRTYDRTEQYTVVVEYTAKPNELKSKGGSQAISGDKGLYFINPLGEEANKMPQIWTQGETEASSCWYPTIDAPNERMTQEIYMTVDNKYRTLSNGVLVYSKLNPNGTRTDYWKQSKPHAPYLTMMAVGEFVKVEDEWNGLDVDYYVEKEYEEHADLIFGMTPDMLEFYSSRLGVDYPWEKYAQIVVRDYVSGAMENTTAVIHGDFVYHDERTALDGTGEDVIAHELFHHWFGDLVTCESWANLPLNESFATYGEYLWNEYRYGLDAADHHIQGDLNAYMAESRSGKQVDMIRFDYADKEDMFDSHSYAKGGRILHMLRNYLGDEAFFEGLRVYLEDNKYRAVEIHDLRLAMEKVCGEDLNWFFNQWFLASGHPVLDINSSYNSETKEVVITIKQEQSLETTPLYKLPMAVDIYQNGSASRYDIVLDKQEQTFNIPVAGQPDLVNVDAQKMLLCEKTENKTEAEYLYQYMNAPLYLDRYEALDAWSKSADQVGLKALLDAALEDPYWSLRSKALKMVKGLSSDDQEALKDRIITMAKEDPKSNVRATAFGVLAKLGADEDLFVAGTSDPSYAVDAAALNGLHKLNPEAGIKEAERLQEGAKAGLLSAIANIYAQSGDEKYQGYMEKALNDASGFGKYQMLATYASYVSNLPLEKLKAGIEPILNACKNGDPWWIKLGGMQALGMVISKLEMSADEEAKTYATELDAKRKAIQEAETNPMVKQYYQD